MLSIPLEFDINWKEIDNGVLAGLTLEDADERHPFPDFMSPFDRSENQAKAIGTSTCAQAPWSKI